MIPIVRGQGGTSEPSGAAARLDREAAARVLATLSSKTNTDESLGSLLEDAFSVALLDALSRIPALPARPAVVEAPRPPADSGSTRIGVTPGEATSLPAPAPAPTVPSSEGERIKQAAARAAVDPRFLQALRRAENGRPGREFGVLSVSAPTYEDQARWAAASIRRNVERFEAGGRTAVDPTTGQYTDEFIRFFSNRYAPVGAGNDPTGLNQHHAARNLIRLYAQIAAKSHGPNPAS